MVSEQQSDFPPGRKVRDLFLRPDYDPTKKLDRDQLRQLDRAERRRARVQNGAESGLFRTWVYAAGLLAFVVGFAVLIVTTS